MSDQTNGGAAAVRSMTGFAQVRRQTALGELSVSLRTVNHRGLDLHFHLGTEFLQFESAMRAMLKERIGRGHVEIRTSLTRLAGTASLGYNSEVLKGYVAAFRAAAKELELDGKPDLNVLLGLPGVTGNGSNGFDSKALDAAFQALLLEAVAECIDALNAVREREGNELRKALLSELTQIEQARAEIAGLRDQAAPYMLARLREKLTELLSGANITEARLAEEAAILADRSDVEEELTRLAIHTQELRRIVEAGGAVGKPLDFLLQEMNRETNTTLSKSSGAGEPALKITNLGLGAKASIERIREQALNLE
jgi:uncharacterized protein (TIGR00255 family)